MSAKEKIDETIEILDEVMNNFDEWEASLHGVLRRAFMDNDELREEWVEAVRGRKQELEDEKDE
jgi:hypothetical protein